MLSEISVHEFREWRAFYDLKPFGEERQDDRIASIVVTLINQWRKRGSRRVRIGEAKVSYKGTTKEGPTASGGWQAMKAMGRRIASAAGAFKKPRK